MNSYQIFQYISSRIENPFLDSVGQIVSALVGYAAAPVQVALVIYIALTGILVMRGHAGEGLGGLVGRAVKLCLVAWIATNGSAYSDWVQGFFLTTLPTDVTQALNGINGSTTIGANSFDVIWNKAFGSGLQVWRTLGTFDIGESIVVVVFWAAAIAACLAAFLIWFLSHVILGLFVAIGPLLVGLVLFPATRSIFERWIGAMLSCVLLQVFTVIMVTITIGVEAQIVEQIHGYTGTNPYEQIQLLFCAIIFFGFATMVAIQLPGAATALAGGLHFHTGALVRAATGAAAAAARTTRSAGVQTAAVAVRGSRAAWQRIRPPTGGSLSSSTGRT